MLGQNRGTQRHRPRKVDGDRELLGVMRKIVETFPRNGCERTHRVLTGPEAFGGWKVNIKRVHRIWKEEHMQVPPKQRKRRRLPGSSANGLQPQAAAWRPEVDDPGGVRCRAGRYGLRGGPGGVAWCVSGRGYAPPSDTPRRLFPNSLMSTGAETGWGSVLYVSRHGPLGGFPPGEPALPKSLAPSWLLAVYSIIRLLELSQLHVTIFCVLFLFPAIEWPRVFF